MKLLAFLLSIFKRKKKPTPPVRRVVGDVKAGELIYIEWYRIAGRIGLVTCLSNDPITKKILIQVSWKNHKECGINEKEKVVFDYSSVEFSNFHLLNGHSIEIDSDDSDIESLQKELSDCLDKEDYEKAVEIRNKINKLSNKNQKK